MAEIPGAVVSSRIPTEIIERCAKAIYAQAQASYAKAAPGWEQSSQAVKMAMMGDAEAALAVVWPAIEALRELLEFNEGSELGGFCDIELNDGETALVQQSEPLTAAIAAAIGSLAALGLERSP